MVFVAYLVLKHRRFKPSEPVPMRFRNPAYVGLNNAAALGDIAPGDTCDDKAMLIKKEHPV